MGGGGTTVRNAEGGYEFDYEANQTEFTGNTTLYRVNTAGGGVSGNITFNPDLSTRTINPQAFIASVPPYIWLLLAAIVGVGFYLGRRK